MLYRHKRVVVDKLTVAVRQLETAIQLWFREEDPVSIHTLAWAAREILRVLHKSTGKKPNMPLGEQLTKLARRKFDDRLAASANFFKHSSKDSNAKHDFSPELATILMLDAVNLVLDISKGNLTGWLVFYLTYLTTISPRRFNKQYLEFVQKNIPADMLRQRSRAEFFKKFCVHLPKGSPLPSFAIEVAFPDLGAAGDCD